MRKNLKKETKKKVIKKIKQNTKRLKHPNKNSIKRFNSSFQSGGFVIDIPPIDLEKLGPVEIIHTLIKKILTVFLTKSIKNIPDSGEFMGKTADSIVDDILEDDTFKFKINTLSSKIVSQIHLTILMTVNAIISFIPVPIIPGLIRDANNGIYNLVKLINKLNEFKDIKNEIIEKFKQEGIEIDEISPSDLINQSFGEIKEQAKFLAAKQLASKQLEVAPALSHVNDKLSKLATNKLHSKATDKLQKQAKTLVGGKKTKKRK